MPPQCPTCGGNLSGRAICPRCGTLVAAEMRLARVQLRIRGFVDGHLAAFPKRIRPHHFLWACAIMPVFILPPLVSLVAAIRSLRRSGDALAEVNFEWIAIISALNIILSGIILYKFHFSPVEIATSLGDFFRSLVDPALRFSPLQKTQPPGVTPI